MFENSDFRICEHPCEIFLSKISYLNCSMIWYNVVLTFGSKDGILASDHSYKKVILRMSSAFLLYRSSFMLYKMVLTFESVGEILKF